jgi:hypothetical protein
MAIYNPVALAQFAADFYQPARTLVIVLSKCTGGFVVLFAIFRLKKFGESEDHQINPWSIIMQLLIGAALCNLPDVIDSLSDTAFGHGADSNPLAFQTATSNANVMAFAVGFGWFFSLVGWIAAYRGLYVLHCTTQGHKNATVAKGLIHLFAAAICVNFGEISGVLTSLFANIFK